MCDGRDDRDPTMPAETPITTRLEAAKKAHQQRQMEMASLSTATGSRAPSTGVQREMSVTNNDVDDDDDDSLFVQNPSTPTRSSNSSGAMLQKQVVTPSTQSVSTPARSSGLSTQPRRRSSERIALRRLSSSGSAFEPDLESPSRGRSTRLHNMVEDNSSPKTPPSVSSVKLAVRPRRVSSTSSNGRGSAGEYMTPSTGRKRRASQTNFSDNEDDDQDAEAMLAMSPTSRAAKRRGILRLQIHVPERTAVSRSDETKSGGADMFSSQSALSGKSPYLSPPSSQEPTVSSSSPGYGRPTTFRMED